MKKLSKNHSVADSYGAGEAATILGVTIPTLKRMVDAGKLQGFRTQGGHLRITSESIEALRDGQNPATPVRTVSTALQNRREHIEELNLETQELRTKRELEKLRTEQEEETKRREGEAEACRQDIAQRKAELKLERQRLQLQQEEERRKGERDRAIENQRRQAEAELNAFRTRWKQRAEEILSSTRYQWLSAGPRKEILEQTEFEIDQRPTTDEPRMPAILNRIFEALTEPLIREKELKERREKITQALLWSFPFRSTESEKLQASAAIEDALKPFDYFADACKMRLAAQEAIRPIKQKIDKRLLDEDLLSWTASQLPLYSRTQQDEERVSRECVPILASLPVDVSQATAKEALQKAIERVCQQIKAREQEKQRQARKQTLIEQGVNEITHYLYDLKQQGRISRDLYLDESFNADVAAAVRRGLTDELDGTESAQEVEEIVQGLVDDELE